MARRLMPDRSANVELTVAVESHVLVTFSKRRDTRCQLQSRPLVLVRFVLVDSNGQPIVYHLTPLQLDLKSQTARSFQVLDRVLEQLPNNREYDRWLTSSLTVHSAFWNARLIRERRIADMGSRNSGELQPGLFDLRAEHAWAAAQQQQRDRTRESNFFTDAAGRQAELTTTSPQIALVLFP